MGQTMTLDGDCPVCGETIGRELRGRPRIYCSDTCRSRAHRAKQPKKVMEFDEWLRFGIEHGYCTEQFCNTHAGYPMHDSEEQAWEEGSDPCAHMVRLGSPEDWDVR